MLSSSTKRTERMVFAKHAVLLVVGDGLLYRDLAAAVAAVLGVKAYYTVDSLVDQSPTSGVLSISSEEEASGAREKLERSGYRCYVMPTTKRLQNALRSGFKSKTADD